MLIPSLAGRGDDSLERKCRCVDIFQRHRRKSLPITGLCLFSMIISGCQEWTTIKIINQYSVPVRVYDVRDYPNYPPKLLGEIAPNAASNFQIIHVADGGSYHFVVRTKEGRVLREIVKSKQQLRSPGEDNGLQVTLTPLAQSWLGRSRAEAGRNNFAPILRQPLTNGV